MSTLEGPLIRAKIDSSSHGVPYVFWEGGPESIRIPVKVLRCVHHIDAEVAAQSYPHFASRNGKSSTCWY